MPRSAISVRSYVANTKVNAVIITKIELCNFHNLASATKRLDSYLAHGLTDATRDKPRGFEGASQSAVKLVAANALLAGAHQVHGLQPMSHGNVAGLEHGADLHGEGFTALVALVGAN